MEEEEKRRIFHEMMQKCFMKCDRFMIEKWKTTKNIYQNQKTRATIEITATYAHRNTGKLGFLKAGGWVKNDGDYYFYMID